MENTAGTMSSVNTFMDKLKKAGKGVVDAGAKTMLKNRKQSFGIEIYDLMEELENGDSQDDKEAQIRAIFDNARKDIAVFRAKKDCKREEMAVLEAEAGGSPTSTNAVTAIPPSSGSVLTNSHPSESG